MTNPTEIVDKPVVINATTTGATITLTDRRYQVQHNKLDRSGGKSTTPVILHYDNVVFPSANVEEGNNKIVLTPSTPPVIVGPGLSSLGFITESGAATLTIVPVGF